MSLLVVEKSSLFEDRFHPEETAGGESTIASHRDFVTIVKVSQSRQSGTRVHRGGCCKLPIPYIAS